MSATEIYTSVQSHYGAAAKGNDNSYAERVAQAFGYSKEELDSIPQEANLGLSCGNPLAIANLKEVTLSPSS
jgi:arsenite methyltransferase